MKRIGLLGLVAAMAFGTVSCSDAEKKLIVEARWRLATGPAGSCSGPYPIYDYLAVDGNALGDGGSTVNANCFATTRPDGSLLFQMSSYVGPNGFTINDLGVDPESCDATTHICNLTGTSARVTIDEDDARIAQYTGTIGATVPTAAGTCQVTQITLDRKHADGKTIELRLACDRLPSDPAGRACYMTDAANTTMPAFFRFSNCEY